MPRSFHTKRNDTTPISGVLKDADLNAVDIQNATLRFHMFKTDGEQIVDAAANNDQNSDGSDGTTGYWSYDFAAADTDEQGTFDAEVEVTFSDGVITTYPNRGYIRVTISKDLA